VNTLATSPSIVLRRPRRADWRALFGVFLTLVAVGGSIVFWTDSSDTRSVVIATRDVPSDATLSLADLAVARVRVDDALYQAAVPAPDLTTLAGRQLAEPIHAHQVLVRAQVSPRPPLGPNQLALTISISPETAVGGLLRPGDVVEVLGTINKGKPEAQTTVVLPRTIVYDVGYTQPLSAVNTSGTERSVAQGPARWLTLVVSPDQAVQLAQAKGAGDLDIALLPPAG
jgi:Flp pilus assembly protein CpaB